MRAAVTTCFVGPFALLLLHPPKGQPIEAYLHAFDIISDEMYFGTGGVVAIEIAIARKTAREERMKAKRAARCGVCIGEGDSRALQLQRARSRMP